MLTALAVIAIIILAILALASTRPNNFSIVRSTDFKASPEKVFAQLNDFKKWGAWSPWEAMDPNLKRTFSGQASGVGAKYAWAGNNKVGEGNMEITHSEPSKKIQLNLNMLKPFAANNITEFTIAPKGTMSTFNWEMRGPSPLMMKIMHLFMDMDGMVGKDFERGIENLRKIVEN